MRLTSKGRYAVMAMADLALHGGEDRAVPLQEVARRQEISLSYLEQLFARMRRAGLVAGVRGPGGGYRLARGSGDMTVAEIIAAVNEPIKATRCEEQSPKSLHRPQRPLHRARPMGSNGRSHPLLPGVCVARRRAGTAL